MDRFKKIGVALACAGAIVLAGCQSMPQKNATQSAQTPSASASTAAAAGTSGTSGQALAATAPKPISGPKSSYQNRVIYFAFNKSIIQSKYFPLLRHQASYLMQHPKAKVLLEGYTDDRGTWEYNIGLGSRRSASVERFLLLQGVDQGQIKTISYGEAYPADPQNNPAAWAKNRRVVMKYLKGASS